MKFNQAYPSISDTSIRPRLRTDDVVSPVAVTLVLVELSIELWDSSFWRMSALFRLEIKKEFEIAWFYKKESCVYLKGVVKQSALIRVSSSNACITADGWWNAGTSTYVVLGGLWKNNFEILLTFKSFNS